ncbi:ABC transporter substrate-binding protein [Bifidobacterium goeldii]|uniref:ABC transporter substrate-binding protein n=1 Tax=Bifidobacterium goeldii TaxID=2306975 RepID=A0A430FJB8_9BIFI|nr:sugar ABC transporter substrate-binding protein [Bifidobacterium goeldii]RSX52882.1 ABC transporter substrate-binding protein [Bifidobacterium goeldii]
MRSLKSIAAATLTVATALSLTACGTTSNKASNSGTSDKPVTLEMWAWEPTYTDVAKKFEAENPNITINITNAGNGTKQYQALNNAISAGSGIPDIAQIEYRAVPQFALSGALKDLSEFGANDYKDFYTASAWNSVNINGGVYALPVDAGPMALFYNKEIFDKAGVTEIPTTLDEYYEAAKKIHALGDDYYITFDGGTSNPVEVMLWAVGAHPFAVDGNKVTIDVDGNEQMNEFIDLWQRMIDEHLVNTKTAQWSDDWSHALNDGRIASLMTGAWMGSMLDDNAPDGAGKWRVAPMPVLDASNPTNGEDGGSTLGIFAASDKAEAAFKFIDYLTHTKEGIKTRVDQGQFPADKATLTDSSFLERTDSYFGDQKINEVLAKAPDTVDTEWQFLPYNVYADTIYGDTAGRAARGETTVKQGVTDWLNELVSYGSTQGFEVSKK